jgi:capsular polysaccharide transport system permease protein
MTSPRARYLFLLVVVFPMFAAVVYYALIAADRYVSESVITVRQTGDSGGNSAPGIAMMLAGVNPPARTETLYVREYIHTLDMLAYLDAELNLRRLYQTQKRDPLFRLHEDAPQEDVLDYFRSRIAVHLDDATGLLTVRVQAFEQAVAQMLNQAILAQSERFVNEISHRMAREQMAFAEGELAKAQERYQSAKDSLIAFQNKNLVLDPQIEAQARSSFTMELESTLARHEAELKNMLTYLNSDAHQVIAQKNLIDSLAAQLASEKKRISSPEGQRLNTLSAQYRNLTIEAGFAEEAYKLAINAVENARIEASRKLKSLVVISSPSLPEKADYPRHLYNLATLFTALMLLYGIIRFAVATIEDHRD